MGALEIIYQSSVSGRRFKRFQCVTNVHYRLVTDNLEQLDFNFSQRVSNCTDKMSGNPRICPVNTQLTALRRITGNVNRIDTHSLGPFHIQDEMIITKSLHTLNSSSCIFTVNKIDKCKTLQRITNMEAVIIYWWSSTDKKYKAKQQLELKYNLVRKRLLVPGGRGQAEDFLVIVEMKLPWIGWFACP